MDEFLTAVLQNSFSVVVAGYLLVRMENRLEGLTGAIARLQATIEHMDRAKWISGAGGDDGRLFE